MAIIGTRGYPSFYGGFETLVRKLAPYLADNSCVVTVYGRAGATDPDWTDLDTRVIRKTTRGIEKRSLSTITYGFTAAVDAVKSRQDTAYVMNVANGFWLPILKMAGIRTVVNVDGIEWEREKWGTAAKLVFRAGAYLTAKFADELVFDAKAIGEYWGQKYGRTGNFIPYGGTPVGEIQLSDLPEEIPEKYVLVVARFVPENSIPEFLEAIPQIAKHVGVVLVGSSGYGGSLDRAADHLQQQFDNVHWLGHVRDDSLLFALWKNATIYFHGHSVGGTNPALVQAMHLSVPIIARDTIYNREVLGDSGIFTGVGPGDISTSIVDALRSPDLLKSISEGALARGNSEYTWEKVNAAYLGLIES